MSAEDDAAIERYGTPEAKDTIELVRLRGRIRDLQRTLRGVEKELQDAQRMNSQREEYVNQLEKDLAEWKRTALREDNDRLQRSTREVPSSTPRTGPSFLADTSGAWCFGERVRSMAGSVSRVVCTQDDRNQFFTCDDPSRPFLWSHTFSSYRFNTELGGGKEAATKAEPQEKVTYENLGPAYGYGGGCKP